jgi:hypothetical protein
MTYYSDFGDVINETIVGDSEDDTFDIRGLDGDLGHVPLTGVRAVTITEYSLIIQLLHLILLK